VYSIPLYAIKFVSDLQQVDGTSVSLTNKTVCHDITEILLKVTLNTITLTLILFESPGLFSYPNIIYFPVLPSFLLFMLVTMVIKCVL